eukprot:1553542-Pyramimonas_sp.AAC.1
MTDPSMDFRAQVIRWRGGDEGAAEATPKNKLLPANPSARCHVFVRARPLLQAERELLGRPVDGRKATDYELNDFEIVT